MKKRTANMDNTSVIIEFDETSQQFHFSYHPFKPNMYGYKNLQTFTNPDEAHFIGEFLENILDAKQENEKVTFAEMKILSTAARRLLGNYNEAILSTPVMN